MKATEYYNNNNTKTKINLKNNIYNRNSNTHLSGRNNRINVRKIEDCSLKNNVVPILIVINQRVHTLVYVHKKEYHGSNNS